jgi:hypothetical protein
MLDVVAMEIVRSSGPTPETTQLYALVARAALTEQTTASQPGATTVGVIAEACWIHPRGAVELADDVARWPRRSSE